MAPSSGTASTAASPTVSRSSSKRNKKKGKGNGDSQSASQESKDDSNVITLKEQLDRALVAVQNTATTTQRLHQQWQSQLLRLCFLLMALTFHQVQGPTTACIREIKAYNRIMMDDENQFAGVVAQSSIRTVSGIQAMVFATQYACSNILGIVMSSFLMMFLYQQQLNVNNPFDFVTNQWYVLSNAMIFPILFVRFMSTKMSPSTEMTGCLQEAVRFWQSWSMPLRQIDSIVAGKAFAETVAIHETDFVRTFPVVIVYHVIVTACYVFMNAQRHRQHQQIESISKLRHDLLMRHDDTQRTGKSETGLRKPDAVENESKSKDNEIDTNASTKKKQ